MTPVTANMEVLDVKRPILSAGKMVRGGYRVILDQAGSYVIDKAGRKLDLELTKGDVFIMRGMVTSRSGTSSKVRALCPLADIEDMKPEDDVPPVNFNPEGLKVYLRTDRKATTYRASQRGGPSWAQVVRRTTHDIKTGALMEDLDTRGYSEKQVMYKIPVGQRDIRTRLYYRDDDLVQSGTVKGQVSGSYRGDDIVGQAHREGQDSRDLGENRKVAEAPRLPRSRSQCGGDPQAAGSSKGGEAPGNDQMPSSMGH